ncbi:hypothetical protein E2320_008603, partial [Naja naja]
SQAAELSTLSAAAIQGSNSNPGAKTDDEEDINHLRGQQLSQWKNWSPNNKPMQSQPASQLICMSCGGNHLRLTCKFRNIICLKCQWKGHIARVCRSGRNFNQPPTHQP